MKRLVLVCAVVTALLAPASASALPYYEVTEPQGEARGVMFVIHGGSWVNTGQQVTIDRRPDAQRFADAGWIVWNIDYRPGAASITDVVAFYDTVKASYPGERICAFGVSAGGHLALMMATRRSVECVLTEASPTDLTDAQAYGAPNWPTLVWTPGQGAFGPDTRPESPAYLTVPSRVHMSWANTDDWVPETSQVFRYASRHPGTTVREVATWQCPCAQWVHAPNVSIADVERLHQEQAAFAAGSGG